MKAYRRIAWRMDRLGLLDLRVRIVPHGADPARIADLFPWSADASLARACAATARLAECLAHRRAPVLRPWNGKLDVYGRDGRIGQIDEEGAFHYSAAPTVDLALSWLLATGSGEFLEPVVHDGWPASPWVELYDLPTIEPGPDLARFYLLRWLKAWGGIRSSRRRNRDGSDQVRRIASGAWKIAGKRILGTELPEPSTFLHHAS